MTADPSDAAEGAGGPWILDLDGVVWLADRAIAGSVDAIGRLRAAGKRVLFLTNNSSLTVGEYLAKFATIGLEVPTRDLCTSAQAAARLVEPGARVLVCGGPGVAEALSERGATPLHDLPPGGRVDAVFVGYHRDFGYDRLNAAFQAIRHGARFIATNDDATYPTPDGPIPGGGAIVAAIAYATGTPAEVAGKPYAPTSALVWDRLGLDPSSGAALTLVGDRPSTDGAMAHALGARFALVLSGVTGAHDLPVEPPPDVTAPNLAALVA